MDYGVWSAPYNARFVYLLNGRSTMERSTIHFDAPFNNTLYVHWMGKKLVMILVNPTRRPFADG